MSKNRILPGALAAVAAMVIGAAAPVQPTTANAPQQTREYTNPLHKAARARRRSNKKKQPWRWDKAGYAVDGTGNYRSAKRLRRRVIMAIAGVPNSGRQWKKTKRILRRHAPEVLTAHPRTLLAHPAARYAFR